MHKPYIKAQLERYDEDGKFASILKAIVYEQDTRWLDELADVVADNSEEPENKKVGFKEFWATHFTQPRRELSYRIRHFKFSKCFNRKKHMRAFERE